MNSYKPFKTVSGNFRKNLYKPNLQKLFLVIDLTNAQLYQTDDNNESDASSDTEAESTSLD